jgi:hypothetical protein
MRHTLTLYTHILGRWYTTRWSKEANEGDWKEHMDSVKKAIEKW